MLTIRGKKGLHKKKPGRSQQSGCHGKKEILASRGVGKGGWLPGSKGGGRLVRGSLKPERGGLSIANPAKDLYWV